MVIFGNPPPAYNWTVAGVCFAVFLTGAVIVEVLWRYFTGKEAKKPDANH